MKGGRALSMGEFLDEQVELELPFSKLNKKGRKLKRKMLRR